MTVIDGSSIAAAKILGLFANRLGLQPVPCIFGAPSTMPTSEQPVTSGNGNSASGIRVTFLDQTGAKSVEAVIAPPVTVARIIPNLITKLSLPITGPDGQPMTYSLDHKEGGRRLREDETLVDAGVTEGDHLIVYPEIVAGFG